MWMDHKMLYNCMWCTYTAVEKKVEIELHCSKTALYVVML